MKAEEVYRILAIADGKDLPENAPNAKGLKRSARKIERKDPRALNPEIVLKRIEFSQALYNAKHQTPRPNAGS